MIPKRIDVTNLNQKAIDYFFYTQSPIEVNGHKYDIEVADILMLCDECDMMEHKYKEGYKRVCSACVACELHLAAIGKQKSFILKEVKE